MSDRWSYEMAIRALELLQRQNADVGGLYPPGGGRVTEPLRGAQDLKELLDYWAVFFDEVGR